MGLDDYEIAELPLGNGTLGIGPIPGRGGFYQADLNTILQWGADVVFTMTTAREMARVDLQELRPEVRDHFHVLQ